MPGSEFSGRRFPFRTHGGPFWSLSVGEESLFAANSLTVCLIWEPSFHTAYSHLERSARACFRIFRPPVPVPDRRRAVLEPKCRKSVPFRPKLLNCDSQLRAVCSYRLHSSRAKWPWRFQNFPVAGSRSGPPAGRFAAQASLFAPNSRTVCLIWEPSVPTAYSHLERSGCASFGIFWSPVPVPDRRRAVLEPLFWKSVPFRPKLLNRDSKLRAVCSYRLLSSRTKCPWRFRNFPVAGSRSGPPAVSFGARVSEKRAFSPQTP